MLNIYKLFVSILIVTLLIGLIGCSNNNDLEEPHRVQNYSSEDDIDNDVSHFLNLEDFLPDKEMLKVFRGGYENSGMVHIVDKITEHRVQIKQFDMGRRVVKIYEIIDDAIILVYVETIEEGNLERDFTDEPDNRSGIVIKGPITVGTTWEETGMIYTITDIGAKVSSLTGVFETMEITGQSDNYTVTVYYGKGMGLIKISTLDFETELVEVYYDTEEKEKVLDNFYLRR